MEQIETNLRRARVKNLLLKGFKVSEIAEKEGVQIQTINKDIRKIGREAFFNKNEESAAAIFGDLMSAVQWAIDEAKAIHNDDEVGRLDALKFMTDERRKLIGVAQDLGLLDKMAEKQEVKHHIEVGDGEVKKYGDWLALHMEK